MGVEVGVGVAVGAGVDVSGGEGVAVPVGGVVGEPPLGLGEGVSDPPPGVCVGVAQLDEQSSVGDAAIPAKPVAQSSAQMVARSRVRAKGVRRLLDERIPDAFVVDLTPTNLVRPMSHHGVENGPSVSLAPVHRIDNAPGSILSDPPCSVGTRRRLMRYWDHG